MNSQIEKLLFERGAAEEPILIRYAGRNELNEIAALIHDSWQAEYRQIVSDDFLDTMSVAERHERLLKRFDEGASDFMVMLHECVLIGASVFGKSFTEGYENDGEISAIYLRHDFIGKGYGHTFFVRVEQELIEKGYDYLVVDLLEGNARAYDFYISHGYERVADRHHRIGENDYPLAVLRKKAVSL